jgi:hypothetical protein
MSKFDEALAEYRRLVHEDGMEDGLEGGYTGWKERRDDIAAAESAVRAIHETDEELIEDLAEALEYIAKVSTKYTDCDCEECRALEGVHAVLLKVANRNKPQGGQAL